MSPYYQRFRPYNNFGLSRLSVPASEKDVGATSEMTFFAITADDFQFLTVVVKSCVLDVADFLEPSLDMFLYFKFNISVGA